MAASPDGKFLAGAHLDSTKHRQVKFGATLWDLNTGKVVKTIGEFQGKVSCLCFSPDGQTLLSSEQSDEQAHHVVQAWDVKTGELTQTFPSHPYRPSAISTDGRVLIGIGANDATEYALIDSEQRTFSPGYRRKLIVASLSTGKRLSQFPLDEIGMENFSITAIATISNEGLIVLGCRRKSQGSFSAILNLLDGSTGRLLHTIGDMYTPLTALAIHTDEHIFASGYENGTIKLWNLSTAQLLSTFVGHESTVSALAFSMDGHQVVSASADGTIKIWGNT
jgi:WD40 repeat protein